MTTTAEEAQSRDWLNLPRDVTCTIFSKVGAISVLRGAQSVCSSWRRICKDPLMWRKIDMHNLQDFWEMDFDLEKMCRYAVDLSDGHVVDINIEYFGTDALLKHIADRSSNLLSLRVTSCYSISDQGLSEAVTKLPLLEELDVSYCSLSKEALEAVGRCCPNLKSLKLDSQSYRFPCIACDDEALAIAENMHELRHLDLFGNKLTDYGLESILNGCPKLESLDLRQCLNVSLGNDLEKRCAEQLKIFRHPKDSADGEMFMEVQDDYLSSDEDYPSGISDIQLMSDESNDYEFSDVSYNSDFGYDDMLL